MPRSHRHPIRRHPVLAAVFAVAVCAALWFGGAPAARWIAWSRWRAQVDAVTSLPEGRVAVRKVLTYRYRGRTRFLEVPVTAEELAADDLVPTDVVFAETGRLRAAYLVTLVRAQSTAPSVRSIARQLRDVRDSLGLDSDEYVELMTSVVQEIPYGTPRPAFDLPGRMLASGRGVCVDKSLLLAALLVHEGYDAGIWSLPAFDHVGTAVRGVGDGFRDSGYAYIETTRRAYVGEIDEDFAANDPMRARPVLAVSGKGRAYRSDVQTEFLVGQRRRAEFLARDLAEYARYAVTAKGRWKREYVEAAERQRVASVLATALASASDDRRLAFARLESLSGWGERGSL